MDSNTPLVTIVLSTYNGDRYLQEQIDSLLSQTYKNIQILIRDDGSTDGTHEILKNYASKNKNIEVVFEKNIGVVASFLRLVGMASSESEFISFCDQDDVWAPEKIARAVSLLKQYDPDTPLLYCGLVEIVDKELQHIRYGRTPTRKLTINNAIVENIATGCTSVINKPAINLIVDDGVCVDNILIHDWWMYILISTFGTVVFDKKPKIKYRQHASNVIGSYSGFKFWLYRIKRQLKKNNKELLSQATVFLDAYGKYMCFEKQEIFRCFIQCLSSKSMLRRFIYVKSMPVYRQRMIDNGILRILILLKKI